MTLGQWLYAAIKKLESITTARLDALVLLEDATHKDRAWLLAHTDFELNASQVAELENQVVRRASHVPLAYIRGQSEFYGRTFKVTPDTLQPRPETETLLDMLKNVKADTIIDVGTGSGCLAITAKLLYPNAKVYATEINEAALKIAKENAKAHKAEVEFFRGNLLEPVLKLKLSLSNLAILANLPYVPDDHVINESAMQEPPIAIFGGPDGLDLYRHMFAQVDKMPAKPAFILCESLPPQHKMLTSIAETSGYTQSQEEDFIQLFSI